MELKPDRLLDLDLLIINFVQVDAAKLSDILVKQQSELIVPEQLV